MRRVQVFGQLTAPVLNREHVRYIINFISGNNVGQVVHADVSCFTSMSQVNVIVSFFLRMYDASHRDRSLYPFLKVFTN